MENKAILNTLLTFGKGQFNPLLGVWKQDGTFFLVFYIVFVEIAIILWSFISRKKTLPFQEASVRKKSSDWKNKLSIKNADRLKLTLSRETGFRLSENHNPFFYVDVIPWQFDSVYTYFSYYLFLSLISYFIRFLYRLPGQQKSKPLQPCYTLFRRETDLEPKFPLSKGVLRFELV